MKRRWLVFALIGVVLVGIATAWFFTHFEEVTVKRRTPPEAEARRNRYLALQRFMARLGRPLELRSDARFIDALPPGGVLILDAGRRSHMTPDRLARLLNWVEAGGYLIVSPDYGNKDILLERLGIVRFNEKQAAANETAEEPDEPEEKGETPPETPSAAGKPVENRLRVAIPGAGRALFAQSQYQGYRAGKQKPSWQSSQPGKGAQYLHFVRGDGHITLVVGFSRQFGNAGIGELDHAEILWTLVNTYQKQLTGPVSLMTRLEIPSLGQWLLESAREAVIASIVLFLLWLWRVVPRFGLPLPDPEPDRRQLREHLAAVGRHVWRSGGLGFWLAMARETFHARLALRHPALAALPPVEQAEALARLTRRPNAMIAAALYGAADSPHAFTSALRTLKNLERSL